MNSILNGKGKEKKKQLIRRRRALEEEQNGFFFLRRDDSQDNAKTFTLNHQGKLVDLIQIPRIAIYH